MLAIPLTYMNRSGHVIPGLLNATGASVEDLLVVCDNLDLPAGTVRIKRRGSARSHNGLASIMDALGTGDFARLYLGIGRPRGETTVIEHVLSVPGDDELELYGRAVDEAAQAVLDLQTQPLDAVMNAVNQR